MKVVLKSIAWIGLQVKTVLGHFMSVHDASWNFDRTSKVEVVVALRVSELFYCSFWILWLILSHNIMHGTGCGNRSLMWYHIKVKFI